MNQLYFQYKQVFQKFRADYNRGCYYCKKRQFKAARYYLGEALDSIYDIMLNYGHMVTNEDLWAYKRDSDNILKLIAKIDEKGQQEEMCA